MDENNAAGKTILIVDDEPHIRALLEETLEDFIDMGVRLLVADNGAKGLELALAHQPDLMLLDVMMPIMNGYDVCETIKKKKMSIYVIMLTAKGQEVDKDKGREVGADKYLTKPFDPDEIISITADILGIEP